LKYNPDKHHRRSIRLKGYDYSQPGWYFVTICTQNRAMLFGDVVNGKMVLNDAGRMVAQCWCDIPDHYPHVRLDKYIIMPNHVHGIIEITGDEIDDTNVGAKNFSPQQNIQSPHFRSPSKTIGSIIRGFKIGVTKWFRQHTKIHTVWQRNYYEHIIRNENDLNRIRKYIIENPLKWQDDNHYADDRPNR
jgi:REP element-mobilizing transposase RayT